GHGPQGAGRHHQHLQWPLLEYRYLQPLPWRIGQRSGVPRLHRRLRHRSDAQGPGPGHRGCQAGTPAGSARRPGAAVVPDLQRPGEWRAGVLRHHQDVHRSDRMTEQSVLAEVRNGVGHLTLNRPAGLNALSLEMVRSLRQQLDAWHNDPAVRLVVLRANGEKAFCAGGDIRGLYDSFKAGDGMYVTFFEEEYAMDQVLHGYPKPVLALMDGFVLGGGMGLAQAASHRVVTERVKMGMPETGIGYFPDVGGSFFLSRLEGAIGQYLGVTGSHIRAADALYCGLADHCISSDLVTELDQALNSQSWSDDPARDLDQL